MSSLQIELLLLGIAIFYFLRFLWSSLEHKLPLAKTEKTRSFIILILNLVIVAGGLSVSLYALNITAGGAKMNEEQLAQLSQWVNSYFALVWILAGIALGAILCWIGEIIIASHKAKKTPAKKEEININISSTELDSMITKFESYEKVATLLGDFLKRVKGDNNGKKES